MVTKKVKLEIRELNKRRLGNLRAYLRDKVNLFNGFNKTCCDISRIELLNEIIRIISE